MLIDLHALRLNLEPFGAILNLARLASSVKLNNLHGTTEYKRKTFASSYIACDYASTCSSNSK